MSTPIHKTQNMRARLAFFDSLQLSQTPAGKPGRSPVCVDLSPHIEGLQAKISAAEPDVRDVPLTMPLSLCDDGADTDACEIKLLTPSQLFSPVKKATLNAAAPEFKPPTQSVSVPASPQANRAPKATLRVSAPEFVPPPQRPMSVPASPMRPAPDAALHSQLRRMAQELDAYRRRAEVAERALAVERASREAKIAPLERELAQTRVAAAAAQSAQQREKDNSDDLRKRISALSDEVCELHAECDALRTQLDSRQVLLCDQRVENVALEKFMNVQKQNSIETQVPFAAPSSIAPPVPVATIQSTVTAPLGAESNTIANVAASENGQDATEGVVARTSRSRRGGRGKGGKGKTMNAVDMPGVKENAAGNANMFGMSVINGMDFRSMSCSTTARVGALQQQRSFMVQHCSSA